MSQETFGDFRIVAVGDTMINRKLDAYKDKSGFSQIIRLIQDADVSVANLETLLHDYEGYPAESSGGTYMRGPPEAIRDLEWAGFNIVSAATNHTGDYSHGGMEATMHTLNGSELNYAGLGKNLAEARSPGYIETSAGRAALVSCCSTMTPESSAGDQRPDMHGRPGLSPLRYNTIYKVTDENLSKIKSVSESLSLGEVKASIRDNNPQKYNDEDDNKFYFLNPAGPYNGDELVFKRGNENKVVREANKKDVENITKQIKASKRQADIVLSSLHYHEGKGGKVNETSVPNFVESFAHSCIDKGANIFIGHGSHTLSGIEIYDDVPIFYGLGNFLAQNETVTRFPPDFYNRFDLDEMKSLPAEAFDERLLDDDQNPVRGDEYWETILPICEFKNENIISITLYPVDLGMNKNRPHRGVPFIASGEKAEKIIRRVDRLSAQYGTSISFEDGKGVVDI